MTNRLGHIDVVRGLAAVGVVYYHMADQLAKRGHSGGAVESFVIYFFTEIVDLGKVSVAVFFFVSGFVVPFSLLRKGYSADSMRHFLVGRFFRLYPAYWVSIPFGIFVLFYLQGRPINMTMIIANVTMLQQFVGIPNLIGVYWTLQIELIFYALCIGLFYLRLLNRLPAIRLAVIAMFCVALTMAFARYYSSSKLPVALPLALAMMFTGMIWRRVALEEDRDAYAAFRPLITVFTALIPVISFLAYNKDYGYNENWIRYTATYYTATVFFLLSTSMFKLRGKFLEYLGLISYSIYLYGLIVQGVVFYLLDRNPQIAETLYTVPHLIIFSTIGLTIALSAIVYRFVESPSIECGRFLAAHWTSRAAKVRL